MGVALWVGEKAYDIGTASFLKSFFSTVYVRCENLDWGSRFPAIMNELYMGELPWDRCEGAIGELNQLQACLAGFSPSDVVWDYEDLEAEPPWGSDISSTITSLADYYVTSDGKEMLEVLRQALFDAIAAKQGLVIR